MKEKTKKQELPVFFTIDGVLHLETLEFRRFVKLLTATEFFYNAGLFILSLEFLEGALYVLTLLNGNNNHFKFFIFI